MTVATQEQQSNKFGAHKDPQAPSSVWYYCLAMTYETHQNPLLLPPFLLLPWLLEQLPLLFRMSPHSGKEDEGTLATRLGLCRRPERPSRSSRQTLPAARRPPLSAWKPRKHLEQQVHTHTHNIYIYRNAAIVTYVLDFCCTRQGFFG